MSVAQWALAWLSGLAIGSGLGYQAGARATRRYLCQALRDLPGPPS